MQFPARPFQYLLPPPGLAGHGGDFVSQARAARCKELEVLFLYFVFLSGEDFVSQARATGIQVNASKRKLWQAEIYWRCNFNSLTVQSIEEAETAQSKKCWKLFKNLFLSDCATLNSTWYLSFKFDTNQPKPASARMIQGNLIPFLGISSRMVGWPSFLVPGGR